MRDNFLIFGQPLIEQDEMNEVLDSMKKAWLGTGAKVHQFETDFATYKEIEYAAAVNSCTAALHLSCLSLGLESGDEIITTPMTFCATVNAIIHAGAQPVLADIDPVTLNIDVREVEKKITPKTRAIIVVHFAGRTCDGPHCRSREVAWNCDN
jgi:dTDP-4-amino-4,6-dideoxygalactose transaminase